MENGILKAKFSNIQKYNSQFSKTNVAIAYHGDNRNWTSINKEVFEKMIPSLYGIPIVGEWKTEDFGSHGGKIEITEDEVNYIETTKPYGFIDSQAKVWWENKTEDDGTVNEYLMAECFLWTGRYPEAEKVLEGNSNQSMEIEVKKAEVREDGFYEIQEAEFSALCILGEEVEPCFEGSGFNQFNLDKDTFKVEFNLMVKELKESFKGGENVTVEEKLEDFVEEEVEVTEEEVIETEEETTEDFDEEEAEEVAEVAEVEEEIEVEEETEEEEVEEEFEADENKEEDSELQEEYDLLKAEFEDLKKVNEKLEEFKADVLLQQKTAEVEDVFNKYSALLDKSEFEDLQDKAMDMDIDGLEKELSYRLVQKKFDFSKIVKRDSTKISIKEEKIDNEPYGSVQFKK